MPQLAGQLVGCCQQVGPNLWLLGSPLSSQCFHLNILFLIHRCLNFRLQWHFSFHTELAGIPVDCELDQANELTFNSLPTQQLFGLLDNPLLSSE